MKHQDVVGLALIALLYVGIMGGALLRSRREKERIRQEKMTGRLPARHTLSMPSSTNVALGKAALVVGGLLWVFLPLAWFLMANVVRLLTPPSAREYLPTLWPLSQILRSNLYWFLAWAGLFFVAWTAERFGNWLNRRLSDPAVSRANEFIQAGDLDSAACELQRAIDSNGPSVRRWSALADVLMKQERWSEVLKISLDIGDRRRFDLQNRRRKELALCKLGFPEIALSEFDRPNTTTERLAWVCSYCHVLIDLGHFDQAWDQLRRAEVLYGGVFIPQAETPHVRKQIDACRARLAEHFGDEKPEGFDDL